MSYDEEDSALVPVQTTVAVTDESRATYERLAAVRDVLAPDLSLNELQLFAMVAVRSGLDPFARQIHAVKRQGRMAIQTGIDGYRSIAARTGEYDGQDEPTYGPACSCDRNPKPHPEYSTVAVYRKGMSRPVKATAYWHEYVPDAGPSGRGDLMWRKMPHVMLAKVAEALALRKAFPWDPTRNSGIGSDIYTSEEMEQASNPEPVSVTERVQQRAQALGAGLTLREFADAVADLDPLEVRDARAELFPDAPTVASLTDAQRLQLYDRLQRTEAVEVEDEETDDAADEEEAGTPPVQQAEAEIVEEEYIPESEPVSIRGGCPVVSPVDGEACDKGRGHRGPHRSKDLKQSW